MRAPSTNALVTAFRDLDRKGANLIRALAHATNNAGKLAALIEKRFPSPHASARSRYNHPYQSHMWRVTMATHAIDVVLGTHGVEPLGTVYARSGPPYEYCDAGDTYSPPLA